MPHESPPHPSPVRRERAARARRWVAERPAGPGRRLRATAPRAGDPRSATAACRRREPQPGSRRHRADPRTAGRPTLTASAPGMDTLCYGSARGAGSCRERLARREPDLDFAPANRLRLGVAVWMAASLMAGTRSDSIFRTTALRGAAALGCGGRRGRRWVLHLGLGLVCGALLLHLPLGARDAPRLAR